MKLKHKPAAIMNPVPGTNELLRLANDQVLKNFINHPKAPKIEVLKTDKNGQWSLV